MPACVSQSWPELGRAQQPVEQRKQLLDGRSNEGRKKKEEKGYYMLCNGDNGKENTGGLKCKSLCPEEREHQGCFGIINQNFTKCPGEQASPAPPCANGQPQASWCSSPSWAPQAAGGGQGSCCGPGVPTEVWRSVRQAESMGEAGGGPASVSQREPPKWLPVLVTLEGDT